MTATPELRPLCFVIMPYGSKRDPTGGPDIDFDRVYDHAIRPAIEAAGMQPLRSDRQRAGGIIHRKMYLALLACNYAVADLTTANANVLYELGIRHAARPGTTVSVFASGHGLPFDVGNVEATPYDLGRGNVFGPVEQEALRTMLGGVLAEMRRRAVRHGKMDSPLFQLLSEWRPPMLAREKTDLFHEEIEIDHEHEEAIAGARLLGRVKGTTEEVDRARQEGLARLRAVQQQLGTLDVDEAVLIFDLLLAYRALSGWDDMVALYDAMPAVARRSVLAREQAAFALNRRAGSDPDHPDRDRACRLLESVEAEQGPSAETCGLLGRIHKDRWTFRRGVDPDLAQGDLEQAILCYRRGYDTDIRDAYPGINAVTLLEIEGSQESLAARDRLLPVVRYAVEIRLAGREPDYWDHATALELAHLARDVETAKRHKVKAVQLVGDERWKLETTLNNLRLIQGARRERGEETALLDAHVEDLRSRMESSSAS